jgi:hypothetical protein
MNATVMTKATEQLTNHTLRLTYNRLGSRVTAVRQSTKGVPKFVYGMQEWTKEQREDWFKEKTANCYTEKRAEIRAKLDKMNEIDDRSITRLGSGKYSIRDDIFEYLKEADVENLERAIEIIRTKLIPRRKEQNAIKAAKEMEEKRQANQGKLLEARAKMEKLNKEIAELEAK